MYGAAVYGASTKRQLQTFTVTGIDRLPSRGELGKPFRILAGAIAAVYGNRLGKPIFE